MNWLQTLAARRRANGARRTIAAFQDRFAVSEVTWTPPAGSPLAYQGSPLRLPLDGIIGPRTLAYGHWHDEQVAQLRALVRKLPGPPRLLVDMGANVGLVTRQLLAPDPGQWVGACCFEPEPGNLAQLRFNLAPLPNITIVDAAVSDASAQRVLHVDSGNAGDCSLDELPAGQPRAAVLQKTVNVISGTHALQHIHAARAHAPGARVIWKSDTQGHDLKIIHALPASFWAEVDVAMIELRCDSASDAEVATLLQLAAQFAQRASVKRGYKPVSLDALAAFCHQRSASEFDLLLHR